MENSKKLLFSTTRIESTFEDNSSFLGTGFFYEIKTSKGTVPGIVSNRHVFENEETEEIATGVEFRINLAKKNNKNEPDIGKYTSVSYPNLRENIIFHPDPKIDLAFIPTAPILKKLTQTQLPYYIKLTSEQIPTDKIINGLSSLEDIYMIGYPSGIFDDVNNLPIIRKGTTATPVYVDYEGDKEFLIDTTVFEGSSGSPVLIYHSGKFGAMKTEEKLIFLGILYSGYDETIEGEIIRKKNKPKKGTKLISKTEIPLNLGIVLKSVLLKGFEEVLEKRLK